MRQTAYNFSPEFTSRCTYVICMYTIKVICSVRKWALAATSRKTRA